MGSGAYHVNSETGYCIHVLSETIYLKDIKDPILHRHYGMVRRVCARVHMRGREGACGREGERKELGYTQTGICLGTGLTCEH